MIEASSKTNLMDFFVSFSDKRSTPESSPTSSPRPNLRRASVGVVPSSGGVAPIATQEQLEEEDPDEENCNESNNGNADIIGKEIY